MSPLEEIVLICILRTLAHTSVVLLGEASGVTASHKVCLVSLTEVTSGVARAVGWSIGLSVSQS